jgi:hypothetical protein
MSQEIAIHVGALAPPFSKQLAGLGLSEAEIEGFAKVNEAITRLYINGYAPPSNTHRMRERMLKQIQKAVDKVEK